LRIRTHSIDRNSRLSLADDAVRMEKPVPTGSNSTMQIYGPYRVPSTQPNSPAQRNQPQKPVDNAAKAAPTDQLDLSNHATGVNRVSATEVAGTGGIRIDRVAEIRRQIADGTYDTPEKIDAALDKFMDQYA
jgi:negative regulator of flagellin synthesis FlgM